MEALTSWFYTQPTLTTFNEVHKLNFFIDDVEHSVFPKDISPSTTLIKYLREKAHLTGTKYMCLEGGCGACVVAITMMDPVTNREVTYSVNSCLIPVYSCFGCKIYTVETIGNKKTGYHPIQKALVGFNGTQCGFCTPGMIMNMYALYKSGKNTMKDVENSFGGNICRCTGYRPILSAFKSLSTDASSKILGTCPNIEDIEDIPVCITNKQKCQSKCLTSCSKEAHYYNFGTSKWVKVFSVNETLDLIREANGRTYMIVGGNTAMGVYRRIQEPEIFIDITTVKNLLHHIIIGNRLILGANTTLTNTMDLFYKLSKENPQFCYLQKLADHIDLIAHLSVRNVGTLAGNLMIKHQHHEFPSDVFLLLETIGATLKIVDTYHVETNLSPADFLAFDMDGKLIKDVCLPALDDTYTFGSYKITQRAQNSHAMVNAGFLLKFNDEGKVERARIVYGGVNPHFVHATKTESLLIDKNLFENETLQTAFRTLDAELDPDYVLPDPTPEFRKKLAISLFYKFVLSIVPDDKISPRYKSGGAKLYRPISFGTQDYETKKSMYPVTKPISKLEALAQCSGDAQYIMDIPDQPNQLFAAFVLAKAPANSVISKIDISEAMKLEEVVAYFDKNDIPGVNNFTPMEAFPPSFVQREELFCSGVVQYYFQPIGIVVATCQEIAEKAADLVDVSYFAGQQPLLSIREIINANARNKIITEGQRTAQRRGLDIHRVIQGKFDISWQYHYQMETQCCLAIPIEDGLEMFPSTQGITINQASIANVLNIPMHKINITVRRLGGAFGSKLVRNALISTAAALAAHKLQQPVKLIMPLTTNMNVIGKRFPLSVDYDVGVNMQGKIQYLNASLYSDLGSSGGNENESNTILTEFGNIYDRSTWSLNMYSTRTDMPTASRCRAPGTCEALASSEAVIHHIASVLNLDPLEVRMQNLEANQRDMRRYIEDIMTWADVDKRKKEVEQFNKDNRWIKKGIAVVPMSYSLLYRFGYWHTMVSIYQADGSVKVAHGGVEMGQGINTKVAQTCAYALGIPLETVSIKPTQDLISPNTTNTGSSFTSEAICYATLRACEILNTRMEPIRRQMGNPTWLQLVQRCYREGIDLCGKGLFTPSQPGVRPYTIYGATCAEVEVDILTGLHEIHRVDIIEDTGDSISPKIDIGQVEGAFVMGIGYWTTEEIIVSPEGELLTNRTWNYKPPGVKDIPIDFKVKFPKNNPNQVGILHSKATGEPPLCLACSVPLAIRDAVASARTEANPNADKWYPFNGPSTVENTFLNSLHDYNQYTL